MLTVVPDAAAGEQPTLPGSTTTDLDELCRMAAQQMLAIALEAERRAYLQAHAHLLDDDGHRLVVGNGHQPPRDVVTAAGTVEVRKPRVDDRRPGETFTSAILPPYMRRSAKVSEVLPLLYLRGLSTGDFAPALAEFFGTDAGLSASTIARLTEDWRAEYQQWKTRSLADIDYVYVWADGVVRREALSERVGCKGPPPVCHSRSVKLEAA